MAITMAAPREFAAAYLSDGTVKVAGFDVEPAWPESGGAAPIYASAFKEPMYDFVILPLSNFLIAIDKGLPLVGLPVFIDVFFPQLGARVNKDAGIESPADLEGKRVGVRGFAFNPAVWLRGALVDMYGIALEKIQWVAAEPNSLSGVDVSRAPGLEVETAERPLDEMLDAGELDAIFWDRGGPAVTEHTATLFADPLQEALKYHLLTGVQPLNSLLLAKKDVLSANPGLGQAVVDASNEARDLYYENVSDDEDHMGLPVKWLRSNGLFPHRNGVAANRTSLEAIVRYAHAQGLISRRYEVEELFFEGAK